MKRKALKAAIISILALVGIFAAQASSYASMVIWHEQPKIPASLIRKD